MIEDLLHSERLQHQDQSLEPTQEMYNRCLWDIKSHLSINSLSLTSFSGFTLPLIPTLPNQTEHRHELRMLIYEQEDLCSKAALMPDPDTLSFNVDQQIAYDKICSSLNTATLVLRLFFINRPGETSKTFVFNALLCHVCLQGKFTLAVATSSIAALLLDGRRTAHSRFKIPLEIHYSSMCSISVNSQIVNLLRATELII